MELEEAIKVLRDTIKHKSCPKNSYCDNDCYDCILLAIETVLQALENKENKINKCIETINELKTGQYIRGAKSYMPSLCCNARLDIIQELLEDK